MSSPHTSIPRSQWLRLWTALPARLITETVRTLETHHRVEDLHLPQSGLGLLPLKDGALGEHYFLGEVPVTRAHVRIRDGQGRTGEGAAVALDDRSGMARALAILDGVLMCGLSGWENAVDLLDKGRAEVTSIERQRNKLLAATRVDFSLLGAEGDDD